MNKWLKKHSATSTEQTFKSEGKSDLVLQSDD